MCGWKNGQLKLKLFQIVRKQSLNFTMESTIVNNSQTLSIEGGNIYFI